MPEWGVPAVYRWERVPTADGAMDLTLTYAAPDRWMLDPWPLTVDALRLVGEGRLLRNRYRGETVMREGLIRAPWVRWESIIVPAQYHASRGRAGAGMDSSHLALS